MNSKYPCHKYPLKWEDCFENSTIQACQTIPPKTFNFPFTCPSAKCFMQKCFIKIYLGWQYNYKVCVLSALDILFSSNHNIYKSLFGLCFWASDPLIERY